MTTLRNIIVSVGILGAVSVSAAEPADSLTLEVGTFIASNVKTAIEQVLGNLASQGLKLDSTSVVEAVKAQLSTPYDEAAHRASAAYISNAVRSRSEKVEKDFLAKAAEAPGATVLPSGVVIRTLIEGVGDNVQPSDRISMRYTGMLPDGTVFDSIGPEDAPMETPASSLVKGFTEALTHMKAGGRYSITLPSATAYGSRGAGDVIPPDTPIRFEVELVDILK